MTRRTTRPEELAAFGRRMAAAQGNLDERSNPEWLAYGQACQDALARRRPVPLLRPALAPPPPPTSLPPVRAQRFTSHGPQWYAPRSQTALSARQVVISPPRLGATDSSRRGTVPTTHAARDAEPGPARRRPVLAPILWGLTWRYAVLGALFLAADSEAQKPWLVMAGVVVGGMLLGLWHRRWPLARLWRTVVVAGGAVYVAPMFSVYPDVLVGSLGALTLAPVMATIRRR